MKLYFDGGCRPNPGKREIAVFSEDGSVQLHDYIGYGTNNEAEWIALIWAMSVAIEKKFDDLTIFGDSSLVINQANGLWKIKQESFLPFFEEFCSLKVQLPKFDLKYIPRDSNLAGQFIEMKQK